MLFERWPVHSDVYIETAMSVTRAVESAVTAAQSYVFKWVFRISLNCMSHTCCMDLIWGTFENLNGEKVPEIRKSSPNNTACSRVLYYSECCVQCTVYSVQYPVVSWIWVCGTFVHTLVLLHEIVLTMPVVSTVRLSRLRICMRVCMSYVTSGCLPIGRQTNWLLVLVSGFPVSRSRSLVQL